MLPHMVTKKPSIIHVQHGWNSSRCFFIAMELAGSALFGMFVSSNRKKPMNRFSSPNAIHIRLYGQIQSRGKNPSRSIKSGSQIRGEPKGMQKLAIMLSTHNAQAEQPQIFFFVHLPLCFSSGELGALFSSVHFLDGVH